MESLLKDLLQVGFSFFVAGYLLVFTQRVLEEVKKGLLDLKHEVQETNKILTRLVDRSVDPRMV